jgi:hypothetical protein
LFIFGDRTVKHAVLLFIPLLALTAPTAHADSLQNVSQATGDSAVASGELGEAGIKLVAGAVGIPFVAAGALSAAPGLSVAASAYDHNDALMSLGVVAAVPGAVVAVPGIFLEQYAWQPLHVSPETMTAHPAPRPAPKSKAPTPDKAQ